MLGMVVCQVTKDVGKGNENMNFDAVRGYEPFGGCRPNELVHYRAVFKGGGTFPPPCVILPPPSKCRV